MLTIVRNMEKICEFILNSISGLGLIILTMITCIDVTGRYFFNSPLPGSTELTEVILGIVVFSSLPIICWKNENIVVDVLDRVFSTLIRNIFFVLINLLISISLFHLGNKLLILASRADKYGQITEHLEIKTTYFLSYMASICYFTIFCLLSFGLIHIYNTYSKETK